MAVLSRDEFFSRLQARLSGDSSDEAITFLEDMTDTYNDLEEKAGNGSEDWEKKYKELDASWKEKYKHRFFSGSGKSYQPVGEPEEEEEKEIMVEDLFKKED